MAPDVLVTWPRRLPAQMLGFAALQVLPFGTPAARVTFVSVLSSAGAAALVYCTILHILRALYDAEARRDARKERGRPGVENGGGALCDVGQGPVLDAQVDARASAVLGAGVYSFSPLVWTYSTQAEVFALNNWFVAALVLLTAMYLVPAPLLETREPEPERKSGILTHAAPAAAPKPSTPAQEAATHAVQAPASGLEHSSRRGSGGVRRIQPRKDTSEQAAGNAAVYLRHALNAMAMTEHRLQEAPAGGGLVLGGFYWRSENLEACDTLVMIVPGSGSPEAGLWSTLSLLREAGPDTGSVLPYLEHASRRGWGMVVLCPNANFEPPAQGPAAGSESRRALAGSESAEAHAVSVWEQVVKPTSARVLIVAHSTGGGAALHIARGDPTNFTARVHAIVLLDSVHKKLPTTDAGVRDLCRTRACNFVTSVAPLGDARPKPWQSSSQPPVLAGGCICRSGGHTDHARIPEAALSAAFDFLSCPIDADGADSNGAHVQAADVAYGNVTDGGQVCSTAGCRTAGSAREQEVHMCMRAGWIPYAGAWLIGLGLTNQHTLVLLALPLAAAVLLAGRSTLLRPGPLLTLVACGLMGLMPYTYLVMAGEQPQRGAWGDPAQLRGLWVHLLRMEYGTFKLFSGSDGQQQGLQSLVTGTQLYLQDLPHQQLLLGPLCALAGAGRMVGANSTRALATTLLVAWGGYTVVFHSLANLPLEHARQQILKVRSIVALFWKYARH
jgi:pimeloyl-ACP methyl ester carboxylesterase